MRIILILAALAAAGLAAPAYAQGGRTPISGCTPGDRVWAQAGDDWLPATLTGVSPGAGQCYVLLDDHLRAGPQVAPMAYTTADSAPAAPDARMIELGSIETPTHDQERAMHAMAGQTHANARVYISRYEVAVQDSSILSRLCNPDQQSAVCQRARGQFYASAAVNDKRIEERNRLAAAEERAARANSEPVNSGFYTSGAGSTGSAPYRPSSGATTSSAPVHVQSESTIRQNQARCRAGSGPC